MLMIKYDARKKTLTYNLRLQRPVLPEMPCTTACYLRLLHFIIKHISLTSLNIKRQACHGFSYLQSKQDQIMISYLIINVVEMQIINCICRDNDCNFQILFCIFFIYNVYTIKFLFFCMLLFQTPVIHVLGVSFQNEKYFPNPKR